MRFVDILYFLFLVTLSLDPTGFHSRLKDLLFVVLVIYGVIYCLKRRQYLAPINRITFLIIRATDSFLKIFRTKSVRYIFLTGSRVS